jgi:hypothetical protein
MPTAIFIKSRNEGTVKLLNQPTTTYDIELWDTLKARLALTDQELADQLNNTP